MAHTPAHKRSRSQAERTRDSNLALKRAKGMRKNYRFSAETLGHITILKSLEEYKGMTETAVIAAVLKSRAGRRARPHERRVGDKRQLRRSRP
jgi:hypothetical protein